MLRLSIWNTALDAANRDTLLDTTKAISLWQGETLLAWFAQDGLKAAGQDYAAGQRADIDVLLQAKGWNPGAAMTGWFIDVPATKGAGFAELPVYTVKVENTEPVPEPGSMLALASGLVGFAGMALRRRRA